MAQATKPKRGKAAASLPEVLTLREAAKFLRLPAGLIEKLAAKGVLPGRKVGDQWRFLRRAIEEWLQGAARNGAPPTNPIAAFKDEPDFDKLLDTIRRQREQLDAELR
jgi:excisionase family DNA binding protein